MQSITTPKEASMFRKHLTRLSVMVITCSILFAMSVEIASAGIRVHLLARSRSGGEVGADDWHPSRRTGENRP